LLELQRLCGNRAVTELIGRSRERPALQRTVMINDVELREPTITANAAQIKNASGASLKTLGIEIAEDAWPALIEELKKLARSTTVVSYKKTSEAIAALHAAGSADAVLAAAAPAAEAAEPEGIEEDWKKYEKKKSERAPAAAATSGPTFTYRHDPHGARKHFSGVLKQGAQWSLSFAAADALMKGDVETNEATLLANSADGAITLFYLSKDNGSSVGTVDTPNRKTSYYTIQIDVDRKQNEIVYHGYPEMGPTLGLGRTTKVKNLPVT
jgi:hypothetical protein